MTTFRIEPAVGADDIESVRGLFLRYAESLGFDLCFQGFDHELAALPGQYAPPAGRLLLARSADGTPSGCVGLRQLDAETCEMKRLYVAGESRGLGLGRLLAQTIIVEARAAGYRRMRLDTLPTMTEAARLYEMLGFREIEPYYENPVAGARFLELDL